MFILQRADHKKRLDRCYSPGGREYKPENAIYPAAGSAYPEIMKIGSSEVKSSQVAFN